MVQGGVSVAIDHPCPWTRIIYNYLKDTDGDTQVLTLAVGSSKDVTERSKEAGRRLLEKRKELYNIVRTAPKHCDGTSDD